MNENNKRNLIFLEKFFKNDKDNPIKICQPKQIRDYDIFGKKEEEKIVKPKSHGSQKLKSVNSYSVIQRKYNIIKESTVFQEIDTQKSFQQITTIKNKYKNNLLKSATVKNSINNIKYNSARNDNNTFLRHKSSFNLNTQYEAKLNNVRIKNILITNIIDLSYIV